MSEADRRAGESCTVRIHALAAGGDGVGRDPDGRVVFVPDTAPGDLVLVQLERARRRHAHGSVLEIVEPGPARVAPPCPVFGRCGGCAWQHLDYAAQLEAKATIVRDALTRIGGVALEAPPAIHPSPESYGYRGRTRVLAEGGRVGFRRRGSRELVAVERCPVLRPALDRALARLAADPPQRDGEWELSCAGEEARAVPLARPRGERLVLEVGHERIGVSPGVFFQANALLLDLLAGRVADWAGEGERAVELYAGAGLFSLSLARRFASLVAVEGQAEAAADLKRNLADAGLTGVDVQPTPVEEALPALAAAAPDALVLDPPRRGLPSGGAVALSAVEARRIVYLSCDPATLARDVRTLRENGYTLDRVEAFDLFPQTPHVESLVLMRRA